jgi:hypothetical protein
MPKAWHWLQNLPTFCEHDAGRAGNFPKYARAWRNGPIPFLDQTATQHVWRPPQWGASKNSAGLSWCRDCFWNALVFVVVFAAGWHRVARLSWSSSTRGLPAGVNPVGCGVRDL